MKLLLFPKDFNLKVTFYLAYILIVSGTYFIIRPAFLSFMSAYMRDEEELILFSNYFLGGLIFIAWWMICVFFWLDLNLEAKFLTPQSRDNQTGSSKGPLPNGAAILLLPCGYMALKIHSYSSWFDFLVGQWPVLLILGILSLVVSIAGKKRKSHLDLINRKTY